MHLKLKFSIEKYLKMKVLKRELPYNTTNLYSLITWKNNNKVELYAINQYTQNRAQQ